MIAISDYNATYIKVNNNNSDIFFLAKDGLTVKGSSGNVIFTTSTNETTTIKSTNITEPKLTTLEEYVVRFKEFIDNV